MVTPKMARTKELLKKSAINGKLITGILTEIGKEVGLSRERVRQIAVLMGYQTPWKTSREVNKSNCKICGNEFQSTVGSRLCCSKECYKTYHRKKYWTTINCKKCKKEKKFLKSLIEIGRKPVFCSKVCQGKWLAEEHGFKSQNK